MPPSSRPDRYHLRILATSDLHMHMLSYDYFQDVAMPGIGLAALSKRIKALRHPIHPQDSPDHTLLVDNGDLLQGSPIEDYVAKIHDRSEPHPVAEVLNNLGYAAVGLGNHDLDFGFRYLSWFARDLKAPLISSNLRLENAVPWIQRFALFPTSGPLVGVVSALPPSSLAGLHPKARTSANVNDIVSSVREAAQLARDAGADVIVCLAHTGLNDGNSDNDLDRLAQDGAVDALVGGHTHLVFPSDLHAEAEGADIQNGKIFGVPMVMPGAFGEFIGCIDLFLDRQPNNSWHVGDGKGRVYVSIADDAAPGPFFAPINQTHAATRASLNRNIAHTDYPLTSYFSRLTPTRKQALNAAAQWSAIDAVRQGTAYADLPLVSAVSTPRAGGRAGPTAYTDIPAGPLKARHVAEMHVYANLIWAVQVTGAELHEWLEKSASVFATVRHNETANLLNTDSPVFDFDVIFGLTYEIDPTQPPRYDSAGARVDPTASRVSALRFEGVPVDPAATFLVATNSFRANGGGRFPNLGPERSVLRPKLPASNVIRDHLTSGATEAPITSWRFAKAARGVKAWYDTGPGAQAHIEDIAHLSPGRPQLQASGFLRIPVTL